MMMDITVINSNSIDDYTILAILGALCIPLEINIRLMYSLKTSKVIFITTINQQAILLLPVKK